MIRRPGRSRYVYAPRFAVSARAVVLGVVALVAVAVGVMLGSALRGTRTEEPPVPPPVARVGDASLAAPAGWVTAAPPNDLPGFVPERSVGRASAQSSIAFTILPRGPSLIPAALEARATEPPEVVRRRGLSALRWRLGEKGDVQTAVVALPTTEATVGLACRGHAWTVVLDDCNRALDRVRLRRGRPLPPSLDAPVVQGLIVAVRRLNAGVPPARKALRAAKTDAARAAAAADAADAVEAATAAADLQGSARPKGQDAVNALAALGRGYRDLSRGFATDSGGLQRGGVARIKEAERALDRELALWRRFIEPPRF